MRFPFLRVTPAALSLSAALLAAAVLAPGAKAEEWTKSYTVSGRANVHLDTNDGSVRVTTGEAKQVELKVIYSGYTVDKNLRIENEVGAGIAPGMNRQDIRDAAFGHQPLGGFVHPDCVRS